MSPSWTFGQTSRDLLHGSSFGQCCSTFWSPPQCYFRHAQQQISFHEFENTSCHLRSKGNSFTIAIWTPALPNNFPVESFRRSRRVSSGTRERYLAQIERYNFGGYERQIWREFTCKPNQLQISVQNTLAQDFIPFGISRRSIPSAISAVSFRQERILNVRGLWKNHCFSRPISRSSDSQIQRVYK